MKFQVILNRLSKYSDSTIDDDYAFDLLENVLNHIDVKVNKKADVKKLDSHGNVVHDAKLSEDIKTAYSYMKIDLSNAVDDANYVLSLLRSKFNEDITKVSISKIVHEIYPTRFNSTIIKRWGKEKANEIITDFLKSNK